MKTITDEYIMQMLPKTKAYVLVILKSTPKSKIPGADKIIWEHGPA